MRSVLSYSFATPMERSPPGSSVRVILQTRILSGFPFPSPGDLPDPFSTESLSLVSPV